MEIARNEEGIRQQRCHFFLDQHECQRDAEHHVDHGQACRGCRGMLPWQLAPPAEQARCTPSDATTTRKAVSVGTETNSDSAEPATLTYSGRPGSRNMW